VLALTSGHTHTLSYLPEETQIETYGADGEFRAPYVATPGVFAKAQDDGSYLINGAWDYSSGCDIATHFMGHVIVPPAEQGGGLSILLMLIDRADFNIIDNWDVVGMRGTGSKRVVVKDVVVPRRRAIPSPLLTKEWLPSIYPNPFYRGHLLSLLMIELAAVSTGIARAALDAYEDVMRAKRVLGPMSPLRFEDPTFQQHFGHASALALAAEAALHQAAADYMALCRRQADGGGAFSDEDNQALFLVEQQIVRLCGEAVDLLFRTGGSSAGKASEPLQRYMRDMAFVRTHMALQPEPAERNYARLHFGLPAESPL
jgi:3-hydroxy-9,10-secoandrosta-1,3,5(10)-triene-9,17-dione monooxygenase